MSTSNITEAVLAELGTPHEQIILNIKDGVKDNQKGAFLKLNPNGRVPTIVHDGTPIWESAAITMYLGETFGVDAGLYPELGPKRGEAMKWIVWSNVSMAEPAARMMRAMGPSKADEEAKACAMRDIADVLGVLNTGLNGRQFLLGDDYTLADTHLQSVVGWLGMLSVDMKPHSNVTAWLERCTERPALKKLGGSHDSE